MAEEWRVSLAIDDAGGLIKKYRFRDLLRQRLGDDVEISAHTAHVFLYAGSAKLAEESRQVVRSALEEQGRRVGEIRLERWDPASEEWRDPEDPAEPDAKPVPDRTETRVMAFLKGAAQVLQYSDPFP